jgi:uncharacterized Zn finger protein
VKGDDPRWWDREPTRPITVADGIKARSRRGAIGQSWWSARFIEVLESLELGGRLSRGRAYARSGQVTELRRTAGAVLAKVQGSRPKPYRVRIGLTTFGKTEWAQVEQAMADSAWYAAKLLAGEMPTDIEEVFSSVGLSLFPTTVRDLSLDCSCPDHEVPCKHLAAVCYLLAESFDEDPFEILALRGRDQETLLDNIRARREVVPAGPAETAPVAQRAVTPALVDCLDSYYRPAAPLPEPLAPAGTPIDAVLDELPVVRLSARDRPLVELLRPLYRTLADPT